MANKQCVCERDLHTYGLHAVSRCSRKSGANIIKNGVFSFFKYQTAVDHSWVARAVSFLVALWWCCIWPLTYYAATAVITPFNAVIVMLAANGLFDGVKSIKK